MPSSVELADGEHVAPRDMLLDRALRELHPGISWSTVRRAIQSGKVRVDADVVRDPQHALAAGAAIVVTMAAPRRAKFRLAKNAIVHLDDDVVVVRKPPGIPSVPDATWRSGTLSHEVAAHLPKRRRDVPLGVVQRLDMETSGLIVFTRTKQAHHLLKQQFRDRTVERSYLAIVAGEAAGSVYRSYLIEHKNGKRSSTRHKKLGKYACTRTELVRKLAGASLIRCVLETGRTHQIRIHLSEAGHPLLGDRRYARRRIECPPAPRVMLHAAVLGFQHPTHQRLIRFEEPLPDDMATVLDELAVS